MPQDGISPPATPDNPTPEPYIPPVPEIIFAGEDLIILRYNIEAETRYTFDMDNVRLASEGGKVYFQIETTLEEGAVADRLNNFNAFRIPGYITFEYATLENKFQQESDKYPIEATL